MSDSERRQRENDLLRCICSLPKNLITLHGTGNLAEFLLHHLCTACCFNFNKAAFFIDNPDFNHLKGIAGVFSHEAFPRSGHWEDPQNFSRHMELSPFNQKVRSISERSPKRNGKEHAAIVRSIADDLELETPLFRLWNMKYDNYGLLIFEPSKDERDFIADHMDSVLQLFSFCPIF